MIEKIKAFFESKVTRAVLTVIFALSATGLFIGGISAEGLSSTLSITMGIIDGVAAVITAITLLIKNNTK